MKKIDIKLIFILLIGVIIIGCTTNTKIDITDSNKKITDIKSFKTISSGSTQTGDVLIELTPHEMEDDKLNVDFSANTHSVDLSQFDLMQITTLEYDGNLIFPESAPKLTGHHTSGRLIFDTGKELNSFKIIIKDIPDIEERVFEWNIN